PYFSFTATPPSATSPLSLHDALPIFRRRAHRPLGRIQVRVHTASMRVYQLGRGSVRAPIRGILIRRRFRGFGHFPVHHPGRDRRSEEHTSELQSRSDLVCRLLLEKKK